MNSPFALRVPICACNSCAKLPYARFVWTPGAVAQGFQQERNGNSKTHGNELTSSVGLLTEKSSDRHKCRNGDSLVREDPEGSAAEGHGHLTKEEYKGH